MTTTKTPKVETRQAKTIRFTRDTSRKLALAKRKLNMSETSCIEAALRLWFRKEEIE